MFKVTLEKTRWFLNDVVRPRPKSIEIPKSKRQVCCRRRHRRLSRSSLKPVGYLHLNEHNGEERIAIQTTSRTLTPPPAPSMSQHLRATHSLHAHPLRSYRQMKHKRISRHTLEIEQDRREVALAQLQSGLPPRSRLRRVNRRILKLSAKSPNPSASNPCADMIGEDLRSLYGEESSVTSSQYITAPSAFRHSSGAEDDQPTVQVLDTDSGVVFEEVRQGTTKKTIPAHVLLEHAMDQASCLVTLSQRPEQACGLTWLAPPEEPLPSFTLTIPTPLLTPSPIFAPQSPITVSQFVSASVPTTTSHVPTDTFGILAPPFPTCDRCFLTDSDSSRCRDCNQQWLACKLWYQANTVGRRNRLSESSIKLGQTHTINSTMTRALNALGSGTRDICGLGISTVPLNRTSIDATALELWVTRGMGNSSPAGTSRSGSVYWKLGLDAFLAAVGDLWTTFLEALASRWSSWKGHAILIFKTLLNVRLPRGGRPCDLVLGSDDDDFLDAHLCEPRRRARITSSSRFVEQLLDSPTGSLFDNR